MLNKEKIMLTTKELQTSTITDLEDGREQVKNIQHRIEETIKQMQRTNNNETWDRLANQHYELKKAKRHIQHLMGKIVAKRMNR